MTVQVEDPMKERDSQPASRRRAAHQIGGNNATDRIKLELKPAQSVKYVIAVSTVLRGGAIRNR
jgi:hypothetical protein